MAGGEQGRRRAIADTAAALVVAATALFLLVHMWVNPAGTPIFGVSADTLPEAMTAVLVIVSLLLVLQSLLGLRRAPAGPAPGQAVPGRPAPERSEAEPSGGAAAARFAGLFLACLAFAAALPWLGFLLSGAALVAASALLLGNRRWLLILAIAILTPLLLDQFFVRAMVIYLPAGRLFQ